MSGDRDHGLPDYLKHKPKHGEWEFPTAWLLGSQLFGALRDIALSAMFKFDPRDWMTAHTIDLHDRAIDGACWIDYLADTGDSPELVYRLARLLQQDELVVGGERLPRGVALVMGGDTAYPIATRRRLIQRVRAPFIWAFDELGKAEADPRVRLLGVPGNHDYYDALGGYEPQFHARQRPANAGSLGPTQRLDLPGYQTEQNASYFAALLPFGWQLWALDNEKAPIDEQQIAYFQSLPATTKRIVATSRPTRVYGALSEQEPELEKSFNSLGLPLAFKNGDLSGDQIRLDLSGDTHTYERYWGDSNYASVVSGLGGAFHHPGQVRYGKQEPRAAWPDLPTTTRAVGERLLRPHWVFQAGAVGILGLVVAMICHSLAWAIAKDHRSVLDAALKPYGGMGDLERVGLLAALIATTLAPFGVLAFAVWLGRKLAPSIIEMTPPSGWWSRCTYRCAHARLSRRVQRWFGASPRNVWGALVTAPAWLLVVVAMRLAWWGVPAIRGNDHAKGFTSIDIATALIALTMTVVGFVVGGKPHGAYPSGFIAYMRSVPQRLLVGVFGLVIGVLMVWIPYAWTMLATMCDWRALAAASVFAYWPLRRGLFAIKLPSWPASVRRWASLVAFALVAAFYVIVPALLVQVHHDDSFWRWLFGLGFAAIAGAYNACLWLGWYFYICLQWNAHANEAGSAARVVEFAEFLRIRLTDDEARVWVIAVDINDKKHPFQVVDQFSVRKQT